MTKFPEWQPIETAPKDGVEVILWNGFQKCCVICFWHDVVGRWYVPSKGAYGGWLGKDIATHWMPLPPAPEEGK